MMFRIALSKEALKYYNRVSVTTAARLDRCFASLESELLKVQISNFLREWRVSIGIESEASG